MYAFAPSSAAVLADWGADVIKVVPPGVADPMMGTPVARLPNVDVGMAFMWEILNRGKRCIGLDVSTHDGHEVLVDLVAGADEFVPLVGPALGDVTSGTFLAGGIAAALFRRERAQRGAIVDVSLLASGMWVLSPGVVASQVYGVETIPRFRHAESPNPLVAA